MKACKYGSTEQCFFNSDDIIYIVQDGYECITCFKNGESIGLSLVDMRETMDKLPRVFSYELYRGVFINPKHISTYSVDTLEVNLIFLNGKQLKKMSKLHFFNNVMPKLQDDRQL